MVDGLIEIICLDKIENSRHSSMAGVNYVRNNVVLIIC